MGLETTPVLLLKLQSNADPGLPIDVLATFEPSGDNRMYPRESVKKFDSGITELTRLPTFTSPPPAR